MATIEELEVEKAALRAARVSLLAGERVTEIQRGDRMMKYATVSVESITAAMEEVDEEIAALNASSGTGKPRYRGLSVGFRAR